MGLLFLWFQYFFFGFQQQNAQIMELPILNPLGTLSTPSLHVKSLSIAKGKIGPFQPLKLLEALMLRLQNKS